MDLSQQRPGCLAHAMVTRRRTCFLLTPAVLQIAAGKLICPKKLDAVTQQPNILFYFL